jgi:hypothetical protein
VAVAELAIITPSYRGDFDLAVDLCRSLDRHVKGDYEHLLIVPRRDVARFRGIGGPHRRILAAEDVLKSAGLYRLPLPTRLRAQPFIDMRIREQWIGAGLRRVTGWVVQQIIKLSSPDLSSASVFVFADSDVVLFRDISLETFKVADTLALHEHKGGLENASHQRWLENARQLLGVAGHEAIAPMNYIGNLIAWRRENVVLLQQALAKQGGGKWQDAIIKIGDVSEYILYGTFCREVLGPSSRHTFKAVDHSLSIWLAPTGDLEDEALGRLAASHVCLHLQSTLGVSLETRHRVLERVSQAVRKKERVATERTGV